MSLFEKLSILLSSVFVCGVLKKDVCFGVMIDYVESFRHQLNVTSREEMSTSIQYPSSCSRTDSAAHWSKILGIV